MKNNNTDDSYTDMSMLADHVKTLMPPQEEKTTRTTFTLPESTHDLIANLKYKPRYKFKVFDSILHFLDCNEDVRSGFLELVKKGFSNNTKGWITKTYTISARAKRDFENLSKKMGVARDILINSAIIQYSALSEINKEKEKENVEEASELLEEVQSNVQDTKNKMDSLLGVDHPITQMFGQVNSSLEKCQTAIDRHLETGDPIDPRGVY